MVVAASPMSTTLVLLLPKVFNTSSGVANTDLRRGTGTQAHRHTGTQAHRHTGTRAQAQTGRQGGAVVQAQAQRHRQVWAQAAGSN